MNTFVSLGTRFKNLSFEILISYNHLQDQLTKCILNSGFKIDRTMKLNGSFLSVTEQDIEED